MNRIARGLPAQPRARTAAAGRGRGRWRPRGLVRKLEVDDRYRGLGLGTLAIRRMQHRHPGYAWRTTAHYPTAGTFWTNVSTEPECVQQSELIV